MTVMNDMKILIVEDSKPMSRLIRTIIGDEDETFTCCDGADALRAYELHKPDWVLMDIKMKKMNGIEATRQIVADHPDARIVIVTNFDDEEFRLSAREAGACNYVLKENLFELRRILAADARDQT